MRRLMIALGMLIGLVGGAAAGAWNGAASTVPALEAQTLIDRVACTHNDQYCPYGRRWSCRPDGRCFCASCGPRYSNEPQLPFFGPQFSGPGYSGQGYSGERQFSPPNKSRWRTWNGCPNNYTVQDGLCKPYTGR